jgi:hypothetical protein
MEVGEKDGDIYRRTLTKDELGSEGARAKIKGEWR